MSEHTYNRSASRPRVQREQRRFGFDFNREKSDRLLPENRIKTDFAANTKIIIFIISGAHYGSV